MTAYIYPGQGSQFCGMGKDLFDSSNDAKKMFEAANKILAACDPLDDVRGSSDYRRILIPRLIKKAVNKVRTLADL